MTEALSLTWNKSRTVLRKLWSILITALISISILAVPGCILVALWVGSMSWVVASVVAAFLGVISICIRWQEIVLEERA